MNTDSQDILKRWTAKRRTALILEILRGDTTVAEAARKYRLTVGEIEEWRDRFLAGAENALVRVHLTRMPKKTTRSNV